MQELIEQFKAAIRNKDATTAKALLSMYGDKVTPKEKERAQQAIDNISNTGDNPMPYNKKGKLKGYKTGKKGGLLYRNTGTVPTVGNFDPTNLAGGVAQKQIEEQLTAGGSIIDPTATYDQNFQNILNTSADLSNVPQYYTDTTVADFTDTQLAAQQANIDAAAKTDALTNDLLSSYQNQLDPTSAYNRQLAQEAAQATTNTFGNAGTLGSARNAVASNLASQNAIRASQEQARSGIAAQRNALTQGADILSGVGAAQQNQLQNIIDEDIKRFNAAQLAPKYQQDRTLGILTQLEAIKQGEAANAANAAASGSGSSSSFKDILAGGLKKAAGNFLGGLFNEGGKVEYNNLGRGQTRYNDVRTPSFGTISKTETESKPSCPEGYFYSEATKSCQPIPGYNKTNEEDNGNDGINNLTPLEQYHNDRNEGMRNAERLIARARASGNPEAIAAAEAYEDTLGKGNPIAEVKALRNLHASLGDKAQFGLLGAVADAFTGDTFKDNLSNAWENTKNAFSSEGRQDFYDRMANDPNRAAVNFGENYVDDNGNIVTKHATWQEFQDALSGKTDWGGNPKNGSSNTNYTTGLPSYSAPDLPSDSGGGGSSDYSAPSYTESFSSWDSGGQFINRGGKVAYRNEGSSVNGEVPPPEAAGVDPMTHPGEPIGTDTVPAWLTEDEFVVDRDSTAHFQPILEAINEWEPGQDDSAVANKIMAELEALINNKAFGDKGMPENAPEKPVSAYAGGMMRRY